MGMFDFLQGGVGDVFGGLISGIGSAAAAKTQAQAQEAINAQNIQEQQREFGISTGETNYWNSVQQQLANQTLGLQIGQASGQFVAPYQAASAQAILDSAKTLGVNPITLAGGLSGGGGVSFGASVGGGAPSGGSPGLTAPSGGGALGNILKGLGAGLSDVGGSVSKVDQLKEQLLGLEIDSTKADIIHKNLINAGLALKTQPGLVQGNGVPLPQADPRFETDIKPALQKFRTTSGIVVEPSRSFTESSFSAIPGLPGSALVAKDVLDQVSNPVLQFPPSVARRLESVPNYEIGNPMGDRY